MGGKLGGKPMAIPESQFPEDPPAAGRRKLVPSPPRRADALFQFSISTLLLVMTLSSACLAVTLSNPLLGIPMSVLALGAFLRTSIAGRIYHKDSIPFTFEMKLGEFIVTCKLLVAALLAAAMSMIAVGSVGFCISASLGELSQVASGIAILATLLLAIGASGFTFAGFLWATRPE
jgi:hypothetical protein